MLRWCDPRGRGSKAGFRGAVGAATGRVGRAPADSPGATAEAFSSRARESEWMSQRGMFRIDSGRWVPEGVTTPILPARGVPRLVRGVGGEGRNRERGF